MKLQNAFEVPLAPSEAWDLLLDIEKIAPCLPGTKITEIVDERTYKGEVVVRLGPVALTFQGRAAFEDIDDQAHQARVKAQGADNKGRGGANANVAFRLVPVEGGSKVEIETDLNLSGSIAQYGRGVGIIQATSEQLIGEFAENLRTQLSQSVSPDGTAEKASGSATGSETGSERAPSARPISGFRLMFRVLWNGIRRLFGGGQS
jgi:carbon monoxide dehydrogenase subunit G